MNAFYLVNIAGAQLYCDADRNKCAPPGVANADPSKPVYFLRNAESLAIAAWDTRLSGFTPLQRTGGQLWQRTSD